MSKKAATSFLLVISFVLCLHADWKADISEYFGNRKDYEGAIAYLKNHLKSADKRPNPIINGLLAYSFHNIKDKDQEYYWLGEYLEYFRGMETIFDFLDSSTYIEISNYLEGWRRQYPLITEMGLIYGKDLNGPAPPDKLVIGIDLNNDVFYKLSDKSHVIKGGLLRNGFNSISIEADDLFNHSGSYVFFLDLKADDLLLRKEIEIDVAMNSSQKEIQVDAKREVERQSPEYKLYMFIDDELIVSSIKSLQKKLSALPNLPPLPENYDPFKPPNRQDPMLNSFSIFSAIGLISELIKGLKKDKNKREPPKPIQKRRQVTATFLKESTQGTAEKIKAVISFKSRHLKASSS